MARVPAKKASAKKSTARKATARKATPAKRAYVRRAAPTNGRRTASPAAAASPAVAAPPAGSADLAGGLRSLLGSVEAEVRAVSALSERIDELVRQLNDARDEQSKRLVVLDTLRGAVDDTNLGTFLDKAIRPRRARVDEVMPDRLSQG